MNNDWQITLPNQPFCSTWICRHLRVAIARPSPWHLRLANDRGALEQVVARDDGGGGAFKAGLTFKSLKNDEEWSILGFSVVITGDSWS